eukprot:symbB.v1.2.038794.t1/scaffold6177.1/size20301/1
MAFEPDRPADIPITMILRNLRRARKGAAPGPSGLTTDTLRLLLDDETSTAQLGQVTQLLAQARVPPTIATAIALGRLVALQKPNGRVRGIVVGDTLRRLVSRCMAQQYASTFQAACQPHQYALSTRAGHAHVITQAEGGEQGDPLMPALFALGQRPALRKVQRQLAPNEYLMAFLDDIYAHLPELTHQILEQLNTHSQAPPALQAAADAARTIAATGWEPPTWAAIASSQTQAPAPPPAPAEGPFARGWQHKASTTAHARLKAELFNAIPPASQALVTSQSGPFASRAFTTIPYTNDFAYPSHLFRILLLRRLRLPLPLFARTCRCRRTFDSLGDHRAACA